jgi:predicted acetyltransferase
MTTPASASRDFPVRTLGDDDWTGFFEVDALAFGGTASDELIEVEREIFEEGRSIGAFDGATPVGIATAYSFDVSVPGGVLPAAGISAVGVLPTHRRRGVLRALMTHQLRDIHERGREPLAILWASEPPIYGRFGYGLASRSYSLNVPRSAEALRSDVPTDPTLRLRLVPAEDWKATADVYAAAAAGRPGMVGRDERWHRRGATDFVSMREGRSALRCVVAEDDKGIRGYARYSTKPDWSTPVPSGTVDVREVIAVDGAALAALYRYQFDIDLMGVTELWNVPTDSPLLHWLNNARSTRPVWHDGLYVRLIDVGTALAQRRYSAPVDVVLEVTDAVCPWNDGRWRLVGGPEGARCERSEDAPDLTLVVTDLGGAYLGGTALGELAAAGRVQVRAGGADVLPAVSAAFATSPAPWSSFIF